MGHRYDVAVIGAGIAGVASALHLLRRGKSVILIDRRDPGLATSYGNAGIIQTYDALPFGVPSLKHIPSILLNQSRAVRVRYRDLPRLLPWILEFYLQSRREPRKLNGRLMRPLNAVALDEHRDLMRGTDAARYLAPAGRIAFYRKKVSFDRVQWELEVARAMGIPFDVLDACELKAIEPSIKPALYRAVNWTSSARLTNPHAVVDAYAERFVREGGFLMQADVLNVASGLRWTIATSGEPVEAAEVVMAAGPWATRMAAVLGYRFPLGIKRGYHRHFAMEDNAQFTHAFADVDGGYVMAPMEEGYRLVTGVELAALNAPPDPVQLDAVLPYAREIFPLTRPVDARPWCGARPCFPDSRPVISRAARHPGLWFNIGHGHSGMTIGPAAGRLLAEMMTGAEPFCDPSPYSAARFNC